MVMFFCSGFAFAFFSLSRIDKEAMNWIIFHVYLLIRDRLGTPFEELTECAAVFESVRKEEYLSWLLCVFFSSVALI